MPFLLYSLCHGIKQLMNCILLSMLVSHSIDSFEGHRIRHLINFLCMVLSMVRMSLRLILWILGELANHKSLSFIFLFVLRIFISLFELSYFRILVITPVISLGRQHSQNHKFFTKKLLDEVLLWSKISNKSNSLFPISQGISSRIYYRKSPFFFWWIHIFFLYFQELSFLEFQIVLDIVLKQFS